MRAADAKLGLSAPKPQVIRHGPAPSGEGAPPRPRQVIPGDGSPGTLAIWWSDFATACLTEQLRSYGVTRRLNVAAEAKGKIPDEAVIETVHVPIEDWFHESLTREVIPHWVTQLTEIMQILRRWRDEGAVVNISCQMGKNRSGAALAVWMCSECGWELEEAVVRLRGITALACGNPHLNDAVAAFLRVEGSVPLNPAGDGGHWVCISPPGTPRHAPQQPQAPEEVPVRAMQQLLLGSGERETEEGSSLR